MSEKHINRVLKSAEYFASLQEAKSAEEPLTESELLDLVS